MSSEEAQPPPSAAAPAPEPKALPPVTTLVFLGPAPYPHARVTEPTPEEQYQEHLRQQERLRLEREEAYAQEREERNQRSQAGNGGALSSLAMLARAVQHNVAKAGDQLHGSVEATVRQGADNRDREKWSANFPAYSESQWMCDYGCEVMHAGQSYSGSLIVTSTHLHWLSDKLKDTIPLTDVVTVCRSIALDTVDHGPPYILPVPAMNVVPSCLQVFTCKKQVFQFLKFASPLQAVGSLATSTVQGSPLERCYNFLDHAWRAAGPVPKPDFEYQPAPQL